jgi:putative transposase
MDEMMREKVALFRYGLVAPLLNEQVDRTTYLTEVSAKKHDVPCYGEKTYAAKTILEWLLFYRRKGFDGLKPGTRSDRGKSRTLSQDQQDHVLALRKQHAAMPITVFYDLLITKGEILPGRVSYSTVHRFLNLHGLLNDETAKAPERKRFAHDKVNMLWQTDASEGPRLRIGGKLVRTYLIAFIDDCTARALCTVRPNGEVRRAAHRHERGADPARNSENGLYRLCRIRYSTDNGKIFRSDILQFACAGLGIQLLHTRAYDPQAKGKIERMFLTCKTRFYTLLQAEPASSIEELNERFWKWLEADYHRRPYASLEGKMPLEVYLSQIEQVRTVTDPAALDTLFLRRAKRTVKYDATFSLDNRLYEVPETFAGQKLEIRYDENGVHVYVEGKAVAEAQAVTFADNAHVKRDRTSLSFKALQESGGTADV